MRPLLTPFIASLCILCTSALAAPAPNGWLRHSLFGSSAFDAHRPAAHNAHDLALATPRHNLRGKLHSAADHVTHVTLFPPAAAPAAQGGGPQAPIVVANFSDATRQPSGFGQLRVWTDDDLPSQLQFYAAGYAEVR
jgi:hypothetical protein